MNNGTLGEHLNILNNMVDHAQENNEITSYITSFVKDTQETNRKITDVRR